MHPHFSSLMTNENSKSLRLKILTLCHTFESSDLLPYLHCYNIIYDSTCFPKGKADETFFSNQASYNLFFTFKFLSLLPALLLLIHMMLMQNMTAYQSPLVVCMILTLDSFMKKQPHWLMVLRERLWRRFGNEMQILYSLCITLEKQKEVQPFVVGNLLLATLLEAP